MKQKQNLDIHTYVTAPAKSTIVYFYVAPINNNETHMTKGM